jgi:hypothetical protein
VSVTKKSCLFALFELQKTKQKSKLSTCSKKVIMSDDEEEDWLLHIHIDTHTHTHLFDCLMIDCLFVFVLISLYLYSSLSYPIFLHRWWRGIFGGGKRDRYYKT